MKKIIILFALLACLSACGGDEPAPTPEPVVEHPTSTSEPPTAFSIAEQHFVSVLDGNPFEIIDNQLLPELLIVQFYLPSAEQSYLNRWQELENTIINMSRDTMYLLNEAGHNDIRLVLILTSDETFRTALITVENNELTHSEPVLEVADEFTLRIRERIQNRTDVVKALIDSNATPFIEYATSERWAATLAALLAGHPEEITDVSFSNNVLNVNILLADETIYTNAGHISLIEPMATITGTIVNEIVVMFSLANMFSHLDAITIYFESVGQITVPNQRFYGSSEAFGVPVATLGDTEFIWEHFTLLH